MHWYSYLLGDPRYAIKHCLFAWVVTDRPLAPLDIPALALITHYALSVPIPGYFTP